MISKRFRVMECGSCAKEFLAHFDRLRSSASGKLFCTHSCYLKWMKGRPKLKGERGGVKVKCPACGTIKAHSKAKMRRMGRHYCSLSCFLSLRKHREVRCAWCDEKLIRELNQVLRAKRFFCNQECCGKWRSKNLSGENSHEWKGGYTLEYGGSNWKSQRKAARKRDNYTCQDCSVIEQGHGYQLDVHHIVSYKRYKNKERANRLENLVTLCRKCHMKRHSRKL